MTRPLQANNLGLSLSFPAETAIVAVEDLPLAGMFQAMELADRQMAAQVKEREEELVLLTQRLESRIEMLTKENAALKVQLETAESLQRETDITHKGEVDTWKKTAAAAEGKTAHHDQLHKQETDALKGHIKLLVDTAHAIAVEVTKKSNMIHSLMQTKITENINSQNLAAQTRWTRPAIPEIAARLPELQSIAQSAADITSQANLLSKLEEKK